MNLKLNKPLCIFDLETTGINITKDRIVEICIVKVFPNGKKETHTWLVNPTIPIPQQSTDVHGITDKKVANAPTFKDLAKEITTLIKGCDLGGFNSNRFDVPLLAEEMLRVDEEFSIQNCKLVDAQVIFHKMEPRNLSAAYKFYCDKDLVGAHSAEADTLATFEILDAQVGKYPEIGNDITSLSKFSQHKKMADFAGFIAFDENDKEILTFGKYKGMKVADVLEKDKGYYSWVQRSDFPLYTKKVLTAVKLRALSTK